MKLKSLLLTSLVALALGACSSNEEATSVDKTAQKNALLTVNLAFPQNASSRTVNEGTPAEQNVQTITLRIHYTAGAVGATGVPSDIVAQFTPSQWTKGSLNANKEMPYGLTKIEVYPGTATVFATINSTTQVGTTNGTTDMVTTTSYTSLDALETGTNVAGTTGTGDSKVGNFIMTGQKDAVTITANQENYITEADPLKVDRIAAKLDEISKKEFVLDDAANITVIGDDGAEVKGDAKTADLTVQLEAFSFVNLNNQSYLFKQTNAFAPTAAAGYLYYFKAQAVTTKVPTNAPVTEWKNIVNTTSGNTNTSVTYCYENAPIVEKADFPAATLIVYKAKFKALTGNFYVIEKNGKKTLYTSFAALDAANNNGYSKGYGLSDTSDAATFYADGVTKYMAGECYYTSPVKTDGVAKIARNNWYKINVTKINTIGGNYVDVPNPPSNSTWLTVNILVEPWTIQPNDINL
jgi:hypothetical protein